MRLTITAPEWARQLISDSTDMDRAPQTLRAGSPPLTLELPDDVYYQYAFVDEAGEVRPDPQWPASTDNLWYGEVSEVCGPEYRPDPLAEVPAERAAGTLERLRLQSPALAGAARRATLYTPAGHDGAELPLVVVQDGVTFMRIGRIAAVLEELLARSEVRPARLLMIEPVDRLVEYAYDNAYTSFVLDELIPAVEASQPTSPRRVWLGASLGGQASAYLLARSREAAVRGAGKFGGAGVARDVSQVAGDAVVALSGAFLGAPGDLDHYRSRRSWLLEWLAGQGEVPGRWYLDVGSLEWLHDVNREAASALGERGAETRLSVRSAGHNWVAWRDALPGALRFALG